MEKAFISLCMICKNEEKTIGNALKSVKDIVDEIIVVDTGSTDNSIDIVKSYGGKVYKEEWNDDFSYIRNIALDKAKGEWILILDCDEIINDSGKDRILRYIRDSKCYKGLNLRVASFINGKKRSIENSIRLFRNDENIRFKGKIQESVKESIIRNYGKESISFTDAQIFNYGNDKNIVDIEEKSKRNLSTLESYGKKDIYYFFRLGNEFGKTGNFEDALQNYDEVMKILEEEKEDMSDLIPKIIINRTKALHQLKMYKEEEDFLEKITKKYSDFRDLYFMECLLRIELYEFAKAKKALDNYINTKVNIKYPSSEFDEVVDIDELKENLGNIDKIIENI